MTKRTILSVLLVFLLTVLAACSGNQGSQKAGGQQSQGQKKDIKFYGKIVEYSSGPAMVAALQKKLPKYNIEGIQVDWGNLQQVIKTGIAGGNPADAYVFWPQQMAGFVSAKQALDLTPYLEANGGEWKKSFVPELLDIGKINGKYYNVPIDANFTLFFINKKIFQQAGVPIPKEWTWDQFMNASKQIQEKTHAFPFGVASGPDTQSWLIRNGVLSLAASKNELKQYGNGEIKANSEIFSQALDNIKNLYDKEYWYPGKGALTVSRDEVTAAFKQGKVAMLAEVSSNAHAVIKDTKFDVAVVPWPSMGSKNAVSGGADGLFIPSNVSDPKASVEVLKAFTSKDVQKIHADAGYAVANKNIKITDPLIKQIMSLSSDIYPYEMQNKSAELNKYFLGELVPNYLLGQSQKSVLDHLEQLREQAYGK